MGHMHQQVFQHQPWKEYDKSWQCFVSGNMQTSNAIGMLIERLG